MKWPSVAVLLAMILSLTLGVSGADKPNILWLTSEDNGPHLGCYGDAYATTPNLDVLASRGMIYLNAWSTAPVCAPARTTIISGLYPPSTGAEHMRSETRLPASLKMYPTYLREAGYYCTNNSKEDYNLTKQGEVWNDSGKKAHWKNRPEGQPFFAIFNYTVSHESQLRTRPHKAVHDPAGVRVPAYHPDRPEVRQDWAQYYDKITEMDVQCGAALKELAEAGLAEDTIVFYYGDHGSGMPRSKRWPYDSGLRVPLIVSVPEKWKHLAPKDYQIGGKTDRLVGFIDLAPTLLSLVGAEVPAHLQGKAFMGPKATPDPEYIYGFRGRMDERYDLVRVIRDKRFIYMRQFMPHKIYGQHIDYMFKTPTTRIWKQMYDAGQLNEAQKHFWEPKPAEELYDLEQDPDEVMNLAGSPEHKAIVARMREALKAHLIATRDIGFLPEHEIHARAAAAGSTPWEVGHDDAKYPMADVYAAADLASSLKPGVGADLVKAMGHADSAVRYWGVMGLLMRGKVEVDAHADALRAALSDGAPTVRLAAAEALAQYGSGADEKQALGILVEHANAEKHGVYLAMQALNALDVAGRKAAPYRDKLAALPRKDPKAPGRMSSYVGRLLEDMVKELE